jgi:hypothetical protein
MVKRVGISVLLTVALSHAALVRIEESQRSPVLNGKPFGTAGPYERIVGRAWFAIDPKLSANRIVTDIDQAPRNAQGLVEFSSDVYILRPRNPRAGNHTVLLEISNRGGKGMLGIFDRAGASADPISERDFGDLYLLEQGYTLAWLGWQFDVPDQPGLMRLYTPSAAGVKGLVRAEIIVDRKETSQSVADRNHRPYRVLHPDDPNLQLTVRDRVTGPRQVVPRAEWHIEDSTRVVLKSGFEPGRIYELVFTSQDPPIAGLGLAAIRDFISSLKYAGDGNVRRAIGFGVSQSGRLLRTYIYYGFNRDEKDRKVFDGVMAHVAGSGRGSFNIRFAQPSRDGHPFLNTLYPTDIFPFTDLPETDPATGMTDGLTAHATPPADTPKIFYTNSSYEYYGRDASLIHTTIDGKGDSPLPPTTRIYFFAGGQHGPSPFPPPRIEAQNLPNPNPYTWSLRALLAAMNAWVKDGKEPPASVYPRVSADQAVPLGAVQFPKIPGVNFPTRIQTAYRADYGPEFRTEGIVTIEPPKLGVPFPSLVPQVDRDGNDVGGVRMPEVQVPLATYTGWNLRARGIGAPDELFSMRGSWIPFPRTRAEREKSGDPRLSIEERYAGKEAYLAKVRAAAEALAAAGFLLPGDVPPLVERSAAEWDFLHQ